jgi:meso-butanediol dehydrogenase/(S,S)-butanediol dehydrogenase/diacetyl reductase
MAEQSLAGKAILVTGAASGIGRATALRLAQDGAVLALADRNREGTNEVAAEIEAMGGKATVLQFEAADPAACRRMVDEAVAALGRLDVVANIAGILQRGPFEEITPETWDSVFAINITAHFHIIQQALPHLTETHGNIVNIASSAAQRGVALSAAYSASKHAVVGLTKSLAAEFKDRHIRVNAISPGPIATPLIMALKPPAGHPQADIGWGQPEDVAAAVAYLASDEARFVNGAVLCVDGGQTAAGR